MGIPKLNKLLMERCPNAIEKIHLETLLNKKIAVDISIYLYKFIADGDYMEHLYLFLSVFKYYCIVPIFIFDGKPPPEKSALLKRRYCEKQEAYREYKSLQQLMSEISDPKKLDELEKTMNSLKKKMVRLTSDHINKAVELIKAFGFEHHFAPNEADQLCVYLTTTGKTYATLSDDMDMIVSGCPIVLRNLSLMNHEVSLYNTTQIVKDLGLSLDEFRDVVVLSGTDYEISSNNTNISIRRAFEYYRKYKESSCENDFYTWLNETGVIENTDLYKISSLMNINTYVNLLEDFIQNNMSEKPKFSVSLIKTIMKQYKFIFIQ
jgi:flap endonuclease-1